MLLKSEFVVLEYTEKEGKKRSDGTVPVYRNLQCFEHGRAYPELFRVDVAPEKESEAKNLAVMASEAPGGLVSLTVDMSMFKGQSRFSFVTGELIR